MKTTFYGSGKEQSVEYTRHADRDDVYDVTWNGETEQVRIMAIREDSVTLLVAGTPVLLHVVHGVDRSLVSIAGHSYEFSHAPPHQNRLDRPATRGSFEPEVRSPMPGKILEVKVDEGDTVDDGQTLILLEAMKMENALTADGGARVSKIHVAAGELVELGQILIELVPLTED